MAENKTPTKETLEKLEREIQAETNSFVRSVGWHLYWELHQRVYADSWKTLQNR
ncbi:MAG TPA: hypothetical protein VN861_02840 [Candidatus Acidoferrales bacterium]|nr:hypothetical protein [Candidatus Acidoferrales bacterium]